MRNFVMAILLLSFVGCGSVYENNPEYPALKLLKTERDSATGQVRVTVLLTRNASTKRLFYYPKGWYGAEFVFKSTSAFALNENVGRIRNSELFSFVLNHNNDYRHDNLESDVNGMQLVQSLPEQHEFNILLKDSDLNKKIGLRFFSIKNNRIDFKNPVTIWVDEIPSIL